MYSALPVWQIPGIYKSKNSNLPASFMRTGRLLFFFDDFLDSLVTGDRTALAHRLANEIIDKAPTSRS